MKRRLTLDYSLGEGWLAPWLDGLRQGRAVASTCSCCGAARFPPLRVCPDCRRPSDGWRTLGGGATILYRSTGSDGDIAMAQFDGATGAAVARAEGLPEGAKRAVLAPCPVFGPGFDPGFGPGFGPDRGSGRSPDQTLDQKDDPNPDPNPDQNPDAPPILALAPEPRP